MHAQQKLLILRDPIMGSTRSHSDWQFITITNEVSYILLNFRQWNSQNIRSFFFHLETNVRINLLEINTYLLILTFLILISFFTDTSHIH